MSESVFEAIRSLARARAPAIGIAAAYGVCVGVQQCARWRRNALRPPAACEVADYLATSRPTAVNLFWAAGANEDRRR